MNTLDYILRRYGAKEKGLVKIHGTRGITLTRMFANLGFTLGAEIGVAKGRFAQILCQRVPNLKLYGIDVWKVYDGYIDTEKTEQKVLDDIYAYARKLLMPYNVQIVNEWSMKAVRRFADESLDFVYIDCNHSYEYVKEDIREWSKKVHKGGIVAGHDYVNEHAGIHFGVKQAVDEWVTENKIPYLFILNKNANIDQMPSWLYVKE